MKKLITFLAFLMFANMLIAQTGKGWSPIKAKYNFKDSTYVAKGIKYPDGTIGTTGFQSGDTIPLSTLVTVRDSLYIGSDGYLHAVAGGYNYRYAPFDSTKLDSQLLTGLTAYWSLEETTGSAVDSSGNGWAGTLSGTISQGTGGKLGKCYNFEADSAGYINFGNTLGSSFDLGDLSISCWINIESQPSNHGIIGTANGENSWYLYNSTGTITGCISDGTTLTSTVANSTISTGEWHHIVFTIDRDSYQKLYIDGVLQTDQDDISAFAASNLSTTNQLNVGTWGDGYWQVCFDGKIDEVVIWSRVLTADEVSDLYNSGSGLAYPF